MYWIEHLVSIRNLRNPPETLNSYKHYIQLVAKHLAQLVQNNTTGVEDYDRNPP